LPCTTSSQETEWVYSYNPGARTGQAIEKQLHFHSWARIMTQIWQTVSRAYTCAKAADVAELFY